MNKYDIIRLGINKTKLSENFNNQMKTLRYKNWHIEITSDKENVNGLWTWFAEGKEGILEDSEGGDLGDMQNAIATIKDWIDEVIDKKRIPYPLMGTNSKIIE